MTPTALLRFLVVLLLLPLLAFAQAGGGIIQGRVFNPATQEYVNNAEVRLEGTKQVTFTESDGSFQFNGVAPGPATIAVNFTGYQPVRESFVVSAGATAVREISLISTAVTAPAATDGIVQLSAFTVSSDHFLALL